MNTIRRFAGLAVAISALLAAGCGGSGSGPATPSAATVLRQLKTAVKGASSVHISGAAAQGGQTAQLDLSVTRAGDMSGTISFGQGPVTILATGGKVYLKLTATSVRAMHLPASSCALFCHKYLQMPAAAARGLTGGMNWSSLMDPTSLPASQAAGAKVSGPVTINGTSAWAVRTKDGSTGYVAAHGPAYLLRITPGRGQGHGQINFTQWNTVTIPPPPAASELVTLKQLGA